MGKPKAPQAPDPVATANAQTQSNQQTAAYNQRLNMVGTNGPTGSVLWSADPSQPGGYTQTTTLSPTEQQSYDLSKAAQNAAMGLAGTQIGRVGEALGQGFDTSGLPALQGSVQGQGQIAQTLPDAGPIKSAFDTGQGVQGQVQQAGPIQNQFNQGQQVQGQLQGTPQAMGYSQGQAVQGQVGANNLYDANLQAQNAAYEQAMSRLNPQFRQQEDRLLNRLSNQGFSANSAGSSAAMRDFNYGKNDAVNQAIYSSIGAGNNAQQQLFNQQLGQGQFANQAAAQQNAQNAQQAGFFNDASNNLFAQQQAMGNFANAAAGQQFSQGLQGAQFGNQAQQQQYGQNANNMQLANQAAAQQYAQNLGAQQFANQAQDQQFGQNLAGGQFQNAAQQQAFQQALQGGQFANQARQQGVNEQAYIQNLPLNQFNSLMSSSQVGTPTGINYTPSQSASTDVLGAYALNQQAQQNAYNQQMGSYNALMGGMMSLGQAAMMGSDVRLKRNIRPLERFNGVNLYAYEYAWGGPTRVGVLAHEVPHAAVDMGGWLAVDYGRL